MRPPVRRRAGACRRSACQREATLATQPPDSVANKGCAAQPKPRARLTQRRPQPRAVVPRRGRRYGFRPGLAEPLPQPPGAGPREGLPAGCDTRRSASSRPAPRPARQQRRARQRSYPLPLLVPVLSQLLLALMCRYFVALAFPPTRHRPVTPKDCHDESSKRSVVTNCAAAGTTTRAAPSRVTERSATQTLLSPIRWALSSVCVPALRRQPGQQGQPAW